MDAIIIKEGGHTALPEAQAVVSEDKAAATGVMMRVVQVRCCLAYLSRAFTIREARWAARPLHRYTLDSYRVRYLSYFGMCI